MKNKVIDVLIMEPVLDDRKSLVQLFQPANYLVKFVSTASEANEYLKNKIPHIILIDIDQKVSTGFKFIEKILDFSHPETVIFVVTSDAKNPKFTSLLGIGVNKIISKPLAGMHVIETIRGYLKQQKILSMEIPESNKANIKMSASLIGVGETDFIIESPIKPGFGSKLNVTCPLIEKILKQKKTFIVAQNKYNYTLPNRNLATMTILGLKNDELQKIRAKILRWEKL